MCIKYRSKQVTYDAGKTTIIQANQLRRFMRDVRTAYPDVLSTAGVDRLSEIISRYAGVDDTVKQAHFNRIHKKA